MVKIVIDAGHGYNTAGKRSPSDEREWSFNNKVAIAAINRLNQYQNVQVLRTDDPTGKTDVPLISRTNKANAWRPDLLVSIHHNALAGKWHNGGGVETFVQEKTASKASKDIAAIIHSRIVKAMGLRDRGVKFANLHMTRVPNCPSILTEGGFFDSTVDILALRDDKKLEAQGVAIADGIAEFFNLKLKPVIVANSPTPVPPSKSQETSKKEEVRMYNPSNQTLRNEATNLLKVAYVLELITSKTHEEKSRNNELSLDDLVGLQAAILGRFMVQYVNEK